MFKTIQIIPIVMKVRSGTAQSGIDLGRGIAGTYKDVSPATIEDVVARDSKR